MLIIAPRFIKPWLLEVSGTRFPAVAGNTYRFGRRRTIARFALLLGAFGSTSLSVVGDHLVDIVYVGRHVHRPLGRVSPDKMQDNNTDPNILE